MATTSLLKANPLKWKQTFRYQSTPHLKAPSNNLSFIKHTKYFSGTLKSNSSTKFNVKCFVTNSSTSSSFSEEEETPTDPIEELLTKTLDDVNTILKTLDSLKESGVATNALDDVDTILKTLDSLKESSVATNTLDDVNAILKTLDSLKESAVATETFEGLLTKAVDDIGNTTLKTLKALREALREPAVAAVLLGALLTCGSSSRRRSYSSGLSSSVSSSDDLELVAFWLNLLVMACIFMLISHIMKYQHELEREAEKTSVIKLQIALSGMGRSLQNDLNRIAETADTSNSKGWSYILTETTKSLLQHLKYCISCHTSVDEKKSTEDGEKCFEKYTTEEREKFDEETLVNVNNMKKKTASSQGGNECITEYLVTTILVAIQGGFELPTINGHEDLKDALQKLSSISACKLRGVEVLWTPQKENDLLLKEELLEDYSLLKPLST